jgi:hypothetical protein
MHAEKADYGYEIEQTQDGYLLSYRQRKKGAWTVALFTLLLTPPWMIALAFTVGVLIGLTMGAALIAALVLAAASGMLIVWKLNQRRPVRTIEVSPEFLDAGGQRYERRHITALFWKGPKTVGNPQPVQANSNTGLVAFGASGLFGVTGVAAAGLTAGTDAVKNITGALAHGGIGIANTWNDRRGWSVWIQYGAKRKRLARKLDQTQAELMTRDIGRMLGTS